MHILGVKLPKRVVFFIGFVSIVFLIWWYKFHSRDVFYGPMFEGMTTNDKVDKKPSTTKKEGFTGANINDGYSSSFNETQYTPVDTNSWMNPPMSYDPSKAIPSAVQSILDRPNPDVPLKGDEMSIFANMPFKPECCPNTYSNSMGCACMNPNTYNYLIGRGGNNVPYSQY